MSEYVMLVRKLLQPCSESIITKKMLSWTIYGVPEPWEDKLQPYGYYFDKNRGEIITLTWNIDLTDARFSTRRAHFSNSLSLNFLIFIERWFRNTLDRSYWTVLA